MSDGLALECTSGGARSKNLLALIKVILYSHPLANDVKY